MSRDFFTSKDPVASPKTEQIRFYIALIALLSYIFVLLTNCRSRYLRQPPFCPSDILPPEGAGKGCGALTSLAPYGGKGLRVRGLN